MAKGVALNGKRGKGKETIVDDVDYERTSSIKWYVNKKGYVVSRYWDKILGRLVHLSLHRFILGAITGTQVDHRDGNRLNNQRDNLRLCSAQGNAQNRRKWKSTASSRYKGVYWHKHMNKWHVQIWIDGKQRSCGYHHDEVEAAQAYNKKAQEIFGEFAVLNVIEGVAV